MKTPPNAHHNRPALATVITFTLLALLLAGVTHHGFIPQSSSGPAMRDFAANWAGVQLLFSGQNPYDSLNATIAPWGYESAQTTLTYLPPWVLVLLSPVMLFSLPSAAVLWIALNVVMLLAAGVLTWRMYNKQLQLPYLLPALLIFYPLWELFVWGHCGIFVFLGIALFMWCESEKRDFLAGAVCVLLTIKMHFLYLFLLAIALYVLVNRRWKIVAGFICTFAPLLAVTLVVQPEVFNFWLESLSQNAVTAWRPASLVGEVRNLVFQLRGVLPTWPMWAIPAATAILVCGSRSWKSLSLKREIPSILCISVFTAPYVWMHDFTVLIFVQVAALALALRSAVPGHVRQRTVLLLLLLQTTTLFCGIFLFREQHQYYWFPVALYLVWLTGSRFFDRKAPN